MLLTRRLRQSTCLVALCLAGLPGARLAAAAPDAEVLFRAGLDARSFQKWGQAVAFFGEAASAEPREGGRVLWYGSWWFDYLPHFYLAEALFHVERFAAAFEESTISLQQGRLGRKERREIQDFVGRFGSVCSRWLPDLEQRWEELERSVRELEATIGAMGGDGAAPGPRTDVRNLGEELEAVDRSLDELISAGGCAGPSPSDQLAARVASSHRVARILEDAQRRLEEAGQALARAAQENYDFRVSRAEEKADEVVEQIESVFRRAPSRPPGPMAAGLHGLNALPMPAQGPGPQTGPRLTSEERAIESYLVAVAKVASGRCDDSLSLLSEAHERLGPAGVVSVHPEVPYRPLLALSEAARNCGDRDLVRRYLVEGAQSGLTNDELKPLEDWLARSETFSPYGGNKYALLVGGVSYAASGLDHLPRVREDLANVARVLKQMGYELPLGGPLLDLSKGALEATILGFLREYGKNPQAALLLYWSGHGETLTNAHEFRTGYILPVSVPPIPENSAEALDLLREEAIDIESFHLWANGDAKNALHTLFVFDSCYSGTVLNGLGAGSRLDEFQRDRAGRPVRMFVASGRAKQKVPADTNFHEEFIRGIRGCADRDDNRHVTASELGLYLGLMVEETTPEAGKSRAPQYEEGDFLFESPIGGRDDCRYIAALGPEGSRPPTGGIPADVAAEIRVWRRLMGGAQDEGVTRQELLAALEVYTTAYPEPYFGVVVDRIRARLGQKEGITRTVRRATGASRSGRVAPHPSPAPAGSGSS